MKIFIKHDKFNRKAVEMKDQIKCICENLNITQASEVAKTDIVVSIGGDGTFLKSARSSFGKPIIGINTGTLGYLTEISPENVEDALKNILDGNYLIDERMMVEGEITRLNGDVIKIPESLNEIAISKNTFGVIRFDAIVNKKLINSYTADGILVCTPTGSTAYNFSCGGPIVDPTAHILTLTPIAPHTVLNRSVILSDDSVVEIKITELRENTSAYVLYDGKAIELCDGDVVKIRRSDKVTKIIKLQDRSFIDNIRETIN